MVKNSPVIQMSIPSLGLEDPTGKEITIHSSTLAWEILWIKEPGRPCKELHMT